jgi:hypothetical protein
MAQREKRRRQPQRAPDQNEKRAVVVKASRTDFDLTAASAYNSELVKQKRSEATLRERRAAALPDPLHVACR